jgi:pimeloyl-ACP methyl ester carboxylesterase
LILKRYARSTQTLALTLALMPALLIVTPATAQVHGRIYPAPRAPVSIAGLSASATIDTVETADGLSLKGIEIAPRDGKPTLLAFHGNGSSAMRSVEWYAPLIAEGYGIVAAEYREYSGNPGKASEAGLAADANAFYARARSLAGSGKLIIVGHSLGGGVAFGLATRQHVDALVTIGAFTRLRDMVSKILRAAVPNEYDNVAAVAKIDEPLYLIHGTADETVPWQMGEQLAKAAQAAHRSGAAIVIKDARHAPDAAVVAMILRAIVAKLDGDGATVKVTLPETVHLYPFSQ